MFTTLSNTKQPRPNARRGLIALGLAVCALAVPSSAIASYGSASDGGPTSSGGSAPDGVPSNAGLVAPDHTSLNASLSSPTTPQADTSSPSGSVDPNSTYSSVSAISGAPAGEPTVVSSSPSSGDSFDWADAALGAGIAMAMVALGGAALLTLRRRTAVSPSA
jgi:hypothetical protein